MVASLSEYHPEVVLGEEKEAFARNRNAANDSIIGISSIIDLLMKEDLTVPLAIAELMEVHPKYVALAVRDRFLKNPEYQSFLTKVFAEAGVDIVRKSGPSLSVPLPDQAPRLWGERPAEERDMNPAAWIRLAYAEWLGHGLARHHIGERDAALGKAYSSWTRKDRHPEDAIKEFAEGNPFGRLNDAEALRRRRANGIESKARFRAAAKMPHP